MNTEYNEAVCTARDYYNSCDADNFYYHIWGGEDIHVGLYESDKDSIGEASRRTVEYMTSKLNGLNGECTVMDIGSGYGGACRYLAKSRGCKVVGLNLSEVENQRGREMNAQQGLDHLIDIVDGSFEAIPYPDDTFDVMWSQDAILHSSDREKVLREVARLLKPGGQFVFTDPMQADTCPPGVLQPILDRIHLDSLGSPGFYQETALKLGFADTSFDDFTPQLANHYGRVLAVTEEKEHELCKFCSPEYIERMKKGLRHWVEGGRRGHLAWGVFHFTMA